VPGTLTTAYLTLKLFQPDFEAVVIPFDQIMQAVQLLFDRAFEAKLIPCRILAEFAE